MERKLTEISPGSYQDVKTVEYKGTEPTPEDAPGSILSYLNFTSPSSSDFDVFKAFCIDKLEIDRIAVCADFVEPGVAIEHRSLICSRKFYFTQATQPGQKAFFDSAELLDCDSQYRLVSPKHSYAKEENLKGRWRQKLDRIEAKERALRAVSDVEHEAFLAAAKRVSELRREEWARRMREKEREGHVDTFDEKLAPSYNKLKVCLETLRESAESLKKLLDESQADLESSEELLEHIDADLKQESKAQLQKQQKVDGINADLTFKDALARVKRLEAQLRYAEPSTLRPVARSKKHGDARLFLTSKNSWLTLRQLARGRRGAPAAETAQHLLRQC